MVIEMIRTGDRIPGFGNRSRVGGWWKWALAVHGAVLCSCIVSIYVPYFFFILFFLVGMVSLSSFGSPEL